eukprot:scaffold4038_cov181-Pinguiococcus_pyrenoidosus.AAC.1
MKLGRHAHSWRQKPVKRLVDEKTGWLRRGRDLCAKSPPRRGSCGSDHMSVRCWGSSARC